MVFIPPIGRPSSPAAEGIAEDAGFNPGDILEGRVVRRVGERYLFVDIGRQLRVKIHWELPFEVKPGEILNFEVVSDDPLTFKLVDPKPESPAGATDGQAKGDEAGERVDIHPEEREPPPAKVTYGPLRGKVVQPPRQETMVQGQPALVQEDEIVPSDPSPSPTTGHSLVDEGEETPVPQNEGMTGDQPGVFREMTDPRFLEDLISLFSEESISEDIVSMLKEDPFFSLYGEMEPVEDPAAQQKGILRNLMLQGLGKEQLTELEQLFSGMKMPKVAELLRMVEETVSQAPEEVSIFPAHEEGAEVQQPLQASGSSEAAATLR